MGRFLQTDPIGTKDDMDLYAYVGDDPVNKNDPSGTLSLKCTQIDDGPTNCVASDDGKDYTTLSFVQGATDYLGNVHYNSPIVTTHEGSAADQLSGAGKQLEAYGVKGAIKALSPSDLNNSIASHFSRDAYSFMSSSPAAEVAQANLPPLIYLHSPEAMEANLSSRNYWKAKSTDEIKKSLQPGKRDSLKVKSDGTVMDGHTRLEILKERGVDINKLPREPY